MPPRVEKKTIEGIDLTVTQHVPLKAFPLLAKLSKAVGPAAILAASVGKDLLKKDVSALTPIIDSLFERVDADETVSLIKDLLSNTLAIYNGKALPLNNDNHINEVFADNFKALALSLVFAAEVNFGNFLETLLAGSDEPEAKASA